MKYEKSLCAVLCLGVFLTAFPALAAGNDEQQIRALTAEFCAAIVKGDLSILDRVFDPSPTNVFYDINEGPLVGLDRLKRVWGAATRNGRLLRFEFGDDLRIDLDGERALETGSWTQEQSAPDGTSREIHGRATILWRKTGDGWRVYHYHASITPRRQR